MQRISETWRVNEAEQLQTLLDQLDEFVRAGDIEKFYDAILNIWLNSMRWWRIPTFNAVLQGTVAIVTP